MEIKSIMTKNPDAVSDEMTLKQAADEMKKYDFGFLPIKHGNTTVGILTDRDIVINGLATGRDPYSTQIKDIMTRRVFSCHETDDIKEVARLMGSKQVNRLVVFDKQDKLTGVVSIGDIARKCHDTTLCGKLTEAIHK